MAYFANDVRVIDDNAEVKTNEIRVTGDLIVEDPNNYDATSGSLINYKIPPAGAANANGAYSGGLYIRAGSSRLGQGFPASNLWSAVTALVIGYYDSSGTDVSSQVGSIKVGDVVYVEMTSTSYAFFEITSTFQNGTNAWINGVTHLSSAGSGNAIGDNDPVKFRYGITGYQWKIRPPTSYTTGQTLYLPNSSSFGGATHLTTFTPSYAASNTISNLDLSGYNFLRVELNGLGTDVNGRYIYMAHNSDRGQCLYSYTNNTGYGAFVRGDINLATGFGYFSSSRTIRFSDGANYAVTSNSSGGIDLGITTSTTSITFYAQSGTWMQAKGTIRLYGYQ